MKEYRVRIRIRYPEVDRMGVVHHSHFPVWFEIGRTELMRELGVPYAKLEADGLFMPVAELAVRYRVPVVYDDIVDVVTVVEDVTGARARFEYRLLREPDQVLAATGFTVHAAVSSTGAPMRIPMALRAALLSVAARKEHGR